MSSRDRKSNPWTVLRSEVKFESQHFRVREDVVSFRGAAGRSYSSVRMNSYGVCVAPVGGDGCVTLVGQYRYVLDRYTWELPGGAMRVGSNPLDAAQAELSEETGLIADQWLKMIDGATSIGMSDEIVQGYVAWDIGQGRSNPDPEEELALRRLPFGEAVEMALRGEISHLIGAALLLAIDARLRQGKLPESLAGLLR